MRLDVIMRAVPERYRDEAIANLLSSQASYLRRDGKITEAVRLGLASMWRNPSPWRLARHFKRRARAAKRKMQRLAVR
jgi:hypothetical protein